eukprot:9428526-Pyramimonas_sp.AAC.1
MWSYAFRQSSAAPAKLSPRAPAASSSSANSHASSSAPRCTSSPAHWRRHRAKRRARPAAHSRYNIGSSQMGRG